MNRKSILEERRTFLRASAGAAIGLALAGCAGAPRQRSGSDSDSPTGGPSDNPVPMPRGDVLVIYFSRAGENYFHGGRKELTVGNTEVVAEMIRDALGCEVLPIHPVDPYPHNYDVTVQRNVDEQNQNARPKIANLPTSLEAYDTILLGSPIWNVRAPRIMLTFAEHFDFTGKKIHPFTTHAMSGLGNVVEEYTSACRGATLGEALAIRGEEAEASRPAVDAWLRRIGLVEA